MSDRPRFVLDTNVLVDAVCFGTSFGRKAFALARQRGVIAYSIQTLAELIDVIYRPRLQQYVGEEERRKFLALFQAEALRVAVNITIHACRDPKDDKFLELAVAAGAKTILTRDRGLLDLHPFQGIQIVEARAFVEAGPRDAP